MGDGNLLLYLNLSGELFYIVAHRMKSQAVPPELQQRVFNDLSLAICQPETINALLGGTVSVVHESFGQVRARMSTIVHSSIMKINDYSMERLFDLTLIATKYQFFVCRRPRDILLIVLNHLDSIRSLVSEPVALEQLGFLHDILVETYGKKPESKMAEYRGSVLNFVQDVKLKMTNLINLGLQRPNGDFVKEPDQEADPEAPSHPVRLQTHEYNKKGVKISESTIVFKEMGSRSMPKPSLERNGDRVIKLGQSIYDYDRPGDTRRFSVPNPEPPVIVPKAEVRSNPSTTSIPESTASSAYSTDDCGSDGGGPWYSVDETQAAETLGRLNAVQGLDLCSTLLGYANTGHRPLILSMEGGGSENLEPFRPGRDDLSVNTVKIEACTDRSALATMVRNLELPDQAPSLPSSRYSQLMESMIESFEESN